MIRGLEYMTHEERLQNQELFSPIYAYKYLMVGNEEGGVRLFSVMPSDRRRGNGHKLKHVKIHMNTRKQYFTVRVAKHGNSLPDWAQCWMSYSKWPCLSKRVGLDILKGSLPIQRFLWYISLLLWEPAGTLFEINSRGSFKREFSNFSGVSENSSANNKHVKICNISVHAGAELWTGF